MLDHSVGHEVHRARPGLGTFVELRVFASSPPQAESAIAAAFRAVERVHLKMSPREKDSDVARINASSDGGIVRVDPWTWRVLAAARELTIESGGVFDVTVEREGRAAAPARPGFALLEAGRVQRTCPVRIDLGGIAKGFAVDRAVAALRKAGASAGVVNAGGDLRVFGPMGHPVWIRHPSCPDLVHAGPVLREQAFATSSNAADPRGAGRLLRPDGRRLWIGRGSVSIQARTCMVADALCKLVAAVGPRTAAPVLKHHRARAFVICTTGRAGREEVRDAT